MRLKPQLLSTLAVRSGCRLTGRPRKGHEKVKQSGLLTANHIQEIQTELEQNNAGFRKVPGTLLKDGLGRVVYTPPQDPDEIEGERL